MKNSFPCHIVHDNNELFGALPLYQIMTKNIKLHNYSGRESVEDYNEKSFNANSHIIS